MTPTRKATAMTGRNGTGSERVETLIVGGGQAGLAAAYHIGRQGGSFLIVDENERIGDSWRNRWDSLRLFTPARYCKLPGVRFPAPALSFPTKDEMGDYLESYADGFGMPVHTGVRIDRLTRDGDRYVATAGRRRYVADNVVVAAGAHRRPRRPAFAEDLDPGIVQIHSASYRGPAQLQDGPVLVVGMGNSGAEISFEVAKTHRTYVSGRPSGQLPFRHGRALALLGFPIIRFLGHHVLTLRTPVGRKVRPRFLKLAPPLIRVKTKDLEAAGAERVGRTSGVRAGKPETEDGRVLDVANVIWCTGFDEKFPWIDLPAFDPDGRPLESRGVVESSPGLYFVGLAFQYAVSSDVLPGVGRDAKHIAGHIAARLSPDRRAEPVRVGA